MRNVMARCWHSARISVFAALVGCAGCNSMNGTFNNQAGMTHYRQGNYTMARAEFQRAAANEPGNADYIANAAAAMKRQGDIAGAERAYRVALNVDPGHQPSYHGLALLMNEQGRTAEAQDLLAGWLDQQPYSAEPYIEMAWLKRETGDIAGTEQLLLNALKVKPNDHVVTAQLGQLYQDTNQPERAAAMYQRSLHARWNQPEVRSRLAQLEQPYGGSRYSTTASAVAVPRYSSATPSGRSTLNTTLGPQSALTPRTESVLPIGQPLAVGSSLENADPAHTGEPNNDAFVEPH
jgi:tetratricopeptide (TPR) repeat protein